MGGSMIPESASSSGPQGSHSGAGSERSGSFRKNLENRIPVSGPSMSKNASPSREIPSVSQYLMLEPVTMSEQKYTCLEELRRVLGMSLEEPPFSLVESKPHPPIALEEVKRFKESEQESADKASDNSKLFHESMLNLDKFCNLISRKRQGNDFPPNEKSGGSNFLKMGNQIPQSSFDLVDQILEDRAKSVVSNKHARSSMPQSEGRVSVPVRQGNLAGKDKVMQMVKDKAMLRPCNVVTTPIEAEIHALPLGGDGWDKKMKRRRSASTVVARIPEGDGELKTAIQQRINNESHAQNTNGLVFRNDSAVPSFANERSDHFAVLDKERSIAKVSTKLNMRGDTQVGSQSSLVKAKGSRQPRTGSCTLMNSASDLLSSFGGFDGWEQPSGLNKIQPLPDATNRKRLLPIGSSSSPVAQWVGQRPQKTSRTRRQNVVSPVSNLDDCQSLSEVYVASDVGLRLMSTAPVGHLVSRGISNSGQQLKVKFDNVLSPAGFLKCEEAGAIENKTKEANNGEVDGRVLNLVHKVSTASPKKNKVSSKKDIGDGVKRQGRSRRSSMQQRACLSLTKDKLLNTDVNKPSSTGRPGSEKSERKVSRTPAKKGSDCKAVNRPGQIRNRSSEVTGESDDDREELLAAARAARDANYLACSSSFWRKMDPYFTFVNSQDLNHLKLQIDFAEEMYDSMHNVLAADNVKGELVQGAPSSPHSSLSMEKYTSQTVMIGSNNLQESLPLFDEARSMQMVSGRLETERRSEKKVPLSQRLLSAFIDEDGIEKVDESTEQGGTNLRSLTDDSLNHSSSIVENENREADLIKAEFNFEVKNNYQQNCSRDWFSFKGYAVPSGFSPHIQNFNLNDELLHKNINGHAHIGSFSELDHSNSDQPQTVSTDSSGTSSACQYEHMSLDERIVMELNSIGLYPETMPDLAEGDEIEKDISELKTRLYQQVWKKKERLQKLERAIQDVKETEERKLEKLAMDKLVEMAYKKLTGGRGSRSHKSGASKISKQLAAAFAKRTLVRCQKFEEEGQSCFSEPPFRDVIFSSLVQTSDSNCLDGNSSGANGKPLSCLPGSRVTGKKKEVLLDDVNTLATSRATSTFSHILPGGAKGKRTDRDRDQNKETSARKSVVKAGHQSVSNGRGKHRTKPKLKQKIAPLSTSGNTLLNRITETFNCVLSSRQESCGTLSHDGTKINQEVGSITQDLSKGIEDNIFTSAPLHSIDMGLDVADGLGGQGQEDFGSWLNVDEDMLQDHDLVGLEIPMDDLSELKFNF